MLQSKIKTFRIRTLLVSAALLAATFSPATAAETAAVAARVNGVPIYESELPPVAEKRLRQYRQLGSKSSDAELIRTFQLKDLDALIAQELLVQAGAAAAKPQEIEDKLAARLADSKARNHGTAELTKEQLQALTTSLRKDILKNTYLEQRGLLNPTIDEKTLRAFYDNNPHSFKESLSIKASHILIRLPKNPTPEQEQEAQAKAGKILDDLKQGKDFALLAIQSSDCNSRENGGELGFIKQNYMPNEFDAVAFKLKPGETSGIVRTRHGLHIIRVDQVKPESVRKYDEVKDFIAGYLKGDYKRQKVDELVQELKKTATIELLLK